MAGDQQSYMEAAAQIVPALVLALLADPNAKSATRQDARRSCWRLWVPGVVGEGFAWRHWPRHDSNCELGGYGVDGFISFAIILPHVKLHTGTLTERIPPFWRYAINRILELVVMAPP